MNFFNIPDTREIFFSKGEVMISSGEIIDTLYYLKKGMVYREIFTEKGNETITVVKQASEDSSKLNVESIVGVLILYEDTLESAASFIAQTDCECIAIPVGMFKNFLKKNPNYVEDAARLALKYNRALQQMLINIREESTPERVCGFLLCHCSDQGNEKVFPKSCTYEKISEFLGINKITVAKIIGALLKEKVLVRSKQGLIIKDEKTLEMYASNNGKRLKYKKNQRSK